jgi:hypothetical protein
MSNNLKHVGVPGMHWGIRKASITPSADHIQSRELKKKHVSELSNKEIQLITTRLSLEKQLTALDPHKQSIGQKIATHLITKYGPIVLGMLIKKYVIPQNPFDVGGTQPGKKSHFHNDPNVIDGTVVG